MIEFELYDVLVHAVPGGAVDERAPPDRGSKGEGRRAGAPDLDRCRGGRCPRLASWWRGDTTAAHLRSDGQPARDDRWQGRERDDQQSAREDLLRACPRGPRRPLAGLDARPSDALNLAVRVGAPIFVDEGVLAEAGFSASDLPQRLDEEQEKLFGERPEKPGEGRSLSPELVRLLWEPPSRRK